MSLPRIAARLVLVCGLVIVVIDAGSTLLTTMQTPEDVRTAGQVAAEASLDRPIDRSTALAAYDAALAQAKEMDIELDPRTFVLEPDGRITLTGTKVAPTLIAGRIGAIRHLTISRSTMTVGALTYR